MVSQSDKAKTEQIVGECFIKAAAVILGSRISETSNETNSSASAASTSKRKWFNLEVDELQSAKAQTHAWRKDFSVPLIIEIFSSDLRQDKIESPLQSSSTDSGLVERWVLAWETAPQRSASSRLEAAAIYKRLVIMLRSLFVQTRILPAYKIMKAGKLFWQGNLDAAPSLSYAIADRKIAAQTSTSRSKRAAVKGMQEFNFTAIETPTGFFKMSVSYLPADKLKLQSLQKQDQGVATNILPDIIQDYVGQSKPRSSLSESLSNATTRPTQVQRATTMQAQPPADISGTSPMSLRRHSWSLASARSQEIMAARSQEVAGRAHDMAAGGSAYSPNTPSKSSRHPQASFQATSRTIRMAVPPLAPGTPGTPMGSSATPPKYPSNHSLGSRVSQAAMSAASKMYNYSRSSSNPFSRSPLHTSNKPSPQKFDEREMRRMSRQVSNTSETADGATKTSQHSTSNPVGIPGSHGASRRLRSSDDLRNMEGTHAHPTSAKKVTSSKHAVSAPVTQVHFGFSPKPSKLSKQSVEPIPSPFAAGAVPGKDQAQVPATPPALYALPSLESGSSCVSSFPTSGSPQLPFACTPSTFSYTDQPVKEGTTPMLPLHRGMQAHSGGQGPAAGWSTRSSGLDQDVPTNVGYSVSTILDSADSSLFSSSAQAYHLPYSLESHNFSPHADPNSSGIDGQSQGDVARMLSTDQMLLMMDDPDHESLPFALDQEIVSSAVSGPEKSAQASGLSSESDAAVGAFVQLIQDAPPLQRSIMPHQPASEFQREGGPSQPEQSLTIQRSTQEMTVQAGLDQLAKLRLSFKKPE